MDSHIFLPPEWDRQSGVQLTWPHSGTDWNGMLDEVTDCFVAIATEIARREKLLVVAQDAEEARLKLGHINDNIIICELPVNDTWARDHAGISVFVNGRPAVANFTFNGWGMKFPADCDNQITAGLFRRKVFAPQVEMQSRLDFVLEGGSIETDGNGTLMTTSQCLLSRNRNEHLSKEEIEKRLKQFFGLRKVLWLNHGHIAGDDTDGHIDTIARFCNKNTIAYLKSDDPLDEHYDDLLAMEHELAAMTDADGAHYRLVPLPMTEPIIWQGERLPSTYANFLVINGAVLAPLYKSDKDAVAMQALKDIFPDREIIGINCLPLIKQHGSLHCVTMQYPEGFLS